MRFAWLRDMVGESYTEEMDKKAAEKIGEGFVTKADFNAVNEAKKALEAQLKGRDRDMAELRKAAGDNAELNKRYQELQEKYQSDTESLSKKLNDSKKNSAIDMAILQAKGRNPKAIKALLDMDKIELKEDGTLTGLDLTALKKSDGYLFELEETVRTGTGTGGGRVESVDPSQMDYETYKKWRAQQ